MLLKEAPPDTSGYMIAGYVIFFLISAIYLLSLIVRRRNLEQDLKTLQTMEAEIKPAPRRSAGGPGRGSGKPASQRKQGRKKVTRKK